MRNRLRILQVYGNFTKPESLWPEKIMNETQNSAHV